MRLGKTGFSCWELIFEIFRKSHSNGLITFLFCIEYVQLKWVIPEKIHTPSTDGTLEILAGGGVKGSGNPGRRGGLDLKILLRGSFSP